LAGEGGGLGPGQSIQRQLGDPLQPVQAGETIVEWVPVVELFALTSRDD